MEYLRASQWDVYEIGPRRCYMKRANILALRYGIYPTVMEMGEERKDKAIMIRKRQKIQSSAIKLGL